MLLIQKLKHVIDAVNQVQMIEIRIQDLQPPSRATLLWCFQNINDAMYHRIGAVSDPISFLDFDAMKVSCVT